eukprot:Plantae.Rhodophyta-Purpureofilum_apyrenoidigerum.ctg11587.p1 GENE.Plantae.Rhodophyta-Purpureofilum_apyrenoidigerum.ctg11587~~Plantae.Rhodophyta-Purpureofilum_apyrenoidigerum.ctg11587.p1  ORF type:complete len:351 (+),score=61.89 Plantae.Rhodophyta-Purpureofilum_apyrenoidigerum.ctg11587:35-1054(+)
MEVSAPVERETTARMENIMWIEKYRPTCMNEVLSHQDVVLTLKKLIDSGRLPHLLFYGPPGTGKTSTILACAKEMYGKSMGSMVLELNASDDRGINVVREQIKTFASTKRIFSSGVKLIILDEADAMTSAAQMALRRVIEKYSQNTRFCLICNYVNKIIPALQSRCTRFRFGPLNREDMQIRLSEICQTEGMKIDDSAIDALIHLSGGDMRKCLNILQSTDMAEAGKSGTIAASAVYRNTGNPLPADIEACTKWLLNEDFNTCLKNISSLLAKGLALQDIMREVHEYIMRSELPVKARIYLYKELGELEYILSKGAPDKLPVHAFVGIFKAVTMLALDG